MKKSTTKPTETQAGGPMRLVNPSTGKMECRVCGAVHWANTKRGGGFMRGSWQCSEDNTCPSREWDENTKRYRTVDNWRGLVKGD